jgi:hypothetical protein
MAYVARESRTLAATVPRPDRQSLLRLALAALALATALAAAGRWAAPPALANHQVLVEGETDFDGDGRLGADEDRDGVDRVFGTLNAAMGNTDLNAPGGPDINATRANHNGQVLVVTSGRFAETVLIGLPVAGLTGGTMSPGVVVLEAAPGVSADIDAFVQGVAGGVERQAAPGIVVNMPANRYAIIRNITSRNWTDGIRVLGDSRVTIEGSLLDSNVEYGIRVLDRARVAIANTQVLASGIRQNPMAASNTANPGGGIVYRGSSSGVVSNSIVAGSVGAGIANLTGRADAVRLESVTVFDNNPDLVGFDDLYAE